MGVLILMAMAAPSAHAALLTYYDFEDLDTTSDSPGLQTTSIAETGVFGFVPNGTQVNAVTSSTGVALGAINFPGTPASFKLGGLTTTGLTDVSLSFALLSSGSGSFTDLNLLYSIDSGSSFHSFATVSNLTSHTSYSPALSFDVSALSNGAVDGVSGKKLIFEFAFTGATNSNSATFIDNIQVNAVPEPSSYIGGLLGLVGLCWCQRRRFMRLLSLRSA